MEVLGGLLIAADETDATWATSRQRRIIGWLSSARMTQPRFERVWELCNNFGSPTYAFKRSQIPGHMPSVDLFGGLANRDDKSPLPVGPS